MKLEVFLFFFLKIFIYLFGRQRLQIGREAGREREGGGSRLLAEQRARCGALSQDPGIMTRAEGRGFNPLSLPGAPKLEVFNLSIPFTYFSHLPPPSPLQSFGGLNDFVNGGDRHLNKNPALSLTLTIRLCLMTNMSLPPSQFLSHCRL